MKMIRTIILVSLVFIVQQSWAQEMGMMDAATWSNQDLNPEQKDRLQKYYGVYPAQSIFKSNFSPIPTVQEKGKIKIELPENPCGELIFKAKDVQFNSQSNYTWYGEIIKQNKEECECVRGHMLIMQRGDEIFGNIHVQDDRYLVESLSGGKNILIKEPSNSAGICGVGIGQNQAPEDHEQEEIEGEARGGGNCDVKVLFLITQEVADGSGNPDNAATNIIETTNQAFRNSKIFSCDLELTLVGVELVTDVDETGMNSQQALFAMRNSAQGQAFRNQLGADIVLGFVDQSISNLGNTVGRAFTGASAGNAYGIFRSTGFGTAPTHEIGHIFGANHEPCVAIDPGTNCDTGNPPNQAHVFSFEETSGWWPFCSTETITQKTVMYSNTGNDVILNFSNPDVSVSGQATGITGDRDNASVLVNAACNVANFRSDNDPLDVDVYTIYWDEGCDGQPATISVDVEGGCPGPYTWQWFVSEDGINYDYISGEDNEEDLDWGFPANIGDVEYFRVDAVSACGETASGFFSIETVCWDGYGGGFVSNDNGIDAAVYPNPSQGKEVKVDLEITTAGEVSYQILDANGRAIQSKDLGYLEVGKYSENINTAKLDDQVLFLQIKKGKEIETKRFVIVK